MSGIKKQTKANANPQTKPTNAPPKQAKNSVKPSRPDKKTLSALDAEALILKKSGKPLTCGQMIEAMQKQGLWQSPGGKTPNATLYSGILREMATKGREGRFKKVDRGQFTYAGK